eukprot:44521_1
MAIHNKSKIIVSLRGNNHATRKILKYVCILISMITTILLMTKYYSHSPIIQTETIPPITLIKDDFDINSCPNITNIYTNSVPIQKNTRHLFNLRYKYPLYLYSDGGSGNTWMRTLLEYVTGISTGCVYGDDQYKKYLFNNEGVCNSHVLVCKAHPIWFFTQMPPVKMHPFGVWKKMKNVIKDASGLVWIIRNPWHSLWSLYQLRFTRLNTNLEMHHDRINISEWNANDFWMDIYMGNREISLVDKWKMQFRIVDMLLNDTQRKWNDERIVRVKYEDLVNKFRRYNELLKIIKHLYIVNETIGFTLPKNETSQNRISPKNKRFYGTKTNKGYKSVNIGYDQLLKRIKCAFEYNYNSNIFHRKHNEYEREKVVTMEYAFKSIGWYKLCKIWHSLQQYASRLGYKQIFYDEFKCEKMSNWSMIHDIDNIDNPNMTRFESAIEEWKREQKKKGKKKVNMVGKLNKRLNKLNKKLNKTIHHN